MTLDPQTVWGFPPTSWSLVRKCRGADERAVGVALDQLCRVYWRPLYAYVRGRRLTRADAEDAVQEFFATALRRELFQRASAEEGKLRSFLLTAMKHHLIDRAAREGAARRRPEGGWAEIDFSQAEAEWLRVEESGAAPDAAYERQWAKALIAQAMARLDARYAAEGKRDVFVALKSEALEEPESSEISTTTEAGLSSGARRVAVHRLRKRFSEALREVVADTLPEGGDVEAELRELAVALKEGGR
ncbi:RNA polymerase sigma factor [Rariglobus hedericola]|uniref:Sigma-70 family RNA polymerase sigma factor n=1 Tax=Rariglobus hedericola TaxID=2597822 RepID=A0A556QJ38_9BACT|nr:sigma-70 family RNA polymerase sigma factor [Rariglobus hedericola]TSJ76642.1 sigma-70 family RNA polymerase sigma factor [Rariglobus hedericola]